MDLFSLLFYFYLCALCVARSFHDRHGGLLGLATSVVILFVMIFFVSW